MRRMYGVTALAICMALGGCGGGSTTGLGGTGGTGGTGGGGGGGTNPCPSTSRTVTVADNTFTPACTTVPSGSTITWTWAGGTDHNVTFSNTQLGASATQTTGTYSKSFPTPGTVGYRCTIHPGMDGSIVVQ